MTPVRSGMEGRVSTLETAVNTLTARVGAIEASIAAQTAIQQSNHAENRSSIHKLQDSQQTMIEQNHLSQQDLVRVKTKLEEVVGTDHGKPGKLDKMEELFTEGLAGIKSEMKSMADKVESVSTISTSRGWLYELGRMVIFGVVAAAVTALVTKLH